MVSWLPHFKCESSPKPSRDDPTIDRPRFACFPWRPSTVVQCRRGTVNQVSGPGRPITTEVAENLQSIALIGPKIIFSLCICMSLPPSSRIGFRRVLVHVLASLRMGSTIPLYSISTYSFGHRPGPLRVVLLGIDQDDDLSKGRHKCRNVSRSDSFQENSPRSYRCIFYTYG